jgi:hypothetical protein
MKTAIEWFVEELTKQNMFMDLFKEEIEQAKEMEKEQLSDAWYAGDEDGAIHEFEQYYNETFK